MLYIVIFDRYGCSQHKKKCRLQFLIFFFKLLGVKNSPQAPSGSINHLVSDPFGSPPPNLMMGRKWGGGERKKHGHK